MVLLYKNTICNLKYRLLYDTQGLSCSIYEASTNMSTHSVDTWCNKYDLQHGTLDHAIEHGRSRAALTIDCPT